VIYFRKEGRALGEVTKVRESPYSSFGEPCEADPTLVPYVVAPDCFPVFSTASSLLLLGHLVSPI